MIFSKLLKKLGVKSSKTEKIESLENQIFLNMKLSLNGLYSEDVSIKDRLKPEIKSQLEMCRVLESNAKHDKDFDAYEKIKKLENMASGSLKIISLCEEREQKHITFSTVQNEEIKIYCDKITSTVFPENENEALRSAFRQKQIRRMQKGKCTVESGLLYLDVIETLSKLRSY